LFERSSAISWGKWKAMGPMGPVNPQAGADSMLSVQLLALTAALKAGQEGSVRLVPPGG
jgi:hypothetical protein